MRLPRPPVAGPGWARAPGWAGGLRWLLLALGLAVAAGCASGPNRSGAGTSRDNPLLAYRVVWGEPELYRPRAQTLGTVERMGTRVVLRGRLESRDRWRRAPKLEPDFALRVAIGCEPGRDADWSAEPGRAWLRRFNSDLGVYFGSGDRLEVESRLAEDGGFSISFPARLLRRPVGEVSEFPVVLGVPSNRGVGISDFHLESEARVRIPGPESLSLTLQRINAVRSPGWGQHDPVALVRAVEHLRNLGQEGALSALDAYLEQLGHESFWPGWRRDPENIDTGSPACVFGIVQLLFEARPGRPAPPRYSTGLLLPGTSPEYRSWPEYPYFVVQGLPFLMGQWAESRTGPDSDPGRALQWARDHGCLREKVLRPVGTPLDALDELEAEEGLPPGNRPRLQLMAAFGDLLGMPFDEVFEDQGDALGFYLPESDDLDGPWREFEGRLQRTALRWDPSAQTFRRR